jgi:hypothetical protein
MDRATAEVAIKALIHEVRALVDEAAGISKAAEACIEAGTPKNAIEIALGLEQPLYEATRLLDAASLMNRLYRT